MEARNQTVQKLRPGYRLGRRIGVMLTMGIIAISLGVLLVLAMGTIKLALLAVGFIVSYTLNLPIDNWVTALISILFVVLVLYEASSAFDRTFDR